ncbi:MAG: alkaline phosphatase family protein [Gemmatimonadota bacterium]|nr:alkaline phosphatase family protein [Gemmatimonadota bacterium]
MLQASGLGDWLVEGNPESRVVSVSGKDRAAILLAGQGVHTVYWFEPQLERFATSTYYREADPDWVVGFNETLAVRLQEDWDWNLEVPDRLLTLARADPAVFEGDGIHTTFPHRFAAEGDTASGGIGAWWSSTPSLDRETTSLAILALSELELGRGNAVDFLALSLSATDRVGHAYGPDSLEQLDNLLRLDAQIGRLLDALDQQVPGRYTLVLTSDHGVSRSPEALQAEGAVARRLTQEDGSRFNERAGEDLRAYGSDPVRLAQALAESARAESWIARAWPDADLAAAASEDSLAALMLESLYPGRAAGLLGRLGVQVVLTPHTLLWAWPRGTDHGSPYLYDRRVPLVFYGAGVAPAVVEGRASTRSIAPTMAWLVGLTTPPGASVAPLVLR